MIKVQDIVKTTGEKRKANILEAYGYRSKRYSLAIGKTIIMNHLVYSAHRIFFHKARKL